MESFDAMSVDLVNPSTMPEQANMLREPKIFAGKLKAYQLKGKSLIIIGLFFVSLMVFFLISSPFVSVLLHSLSLTLVLASSSS